MRRMKLAAIGTFVLKAAAQLECPPTVFVTYTSIVGSSESASNSPSVTSTQSAITGTASSISKQIITVTETSVSTFTQNVWSGTVKAKIMTGVRTITKEFERYASGDNLIGIRVTSNSCPGVPTSTITVTGTSPQSLSSSSEEPNPTITTSSAIGESTTTSISTKPFTTSTSSASHTSASQSSSGLSSHSTSELDPSASITKTSSTPQLTFGDPSSSFPFPTPPSSNLSSDFWLVATPTLTIKSDGTYQLPCYTFPTTWSYVLSPPKYTTSLCKPHCGSINFRSETAIPQPKTTVTRVCYPRMTATETGKITFSPNPVLATATQTIQAPVGWDKCPPKHPNTAEQDNDSKCGLGDKGKHYQCKKNVCCGPNGECGTGWKYCNEGCQPNWGFCWKNSTSCEAPEAPSESDEQHSVDIFPIWYDAPDVPPPPDLPWPPVYFIEHSGGASDDVGYMTNCEKTPPEEGEGDCDPKLTVTDKTVYCDLVTNIAGQSSETCTSTAEGTRTGCEVVPKTTTVTTTSCETTTAEHTSVFCSVQTGDITCTATRTSVHSGCDISASTTTSISYSELVCELSETAPYIQIVPETPGGQQWPITFGVNATDSEAPTTSAPADVSSGSITSATVSATSSSSITCAPPSVASLPACTPIVAPGFNEPITEMFEPSDIVPTTTAAAKAIRQADSGAGNGETVTTGSISCYCGTDPALTVWPVSTCSTLLCPNQAASWQATGSPVHLTVDSNADIIPTASNTAMPTTSATGAPAGKRVAGRMSDEGPFLGVGSWLGKFLKW
ncbi:hypothetical protein HII31_02166, partial [Pseudocercospora fuligena]